MHFLSFLKSCKLNTLLLPLLKKNNTWMIKLTLHNKVLSFHEDSFIIILYKVLKLHFFSPQIIDVAQNRCSFEQLATFNLNSLMKQVAKFCEIWLFPVFIFPVYSTVVKWNNTTSLTIVFVLGKAKAS